MREEVLEPTAKSLKGKYAFVSPKEVFDSFVVFRHPHSLEVQIGRGSDGAIDGVVDLGRSRCVWVHIRNDSGQTSFNRWNECSDTGRLIPAVEAKPPALKEQFPEDFEQEA